MSKYFDVTEENQEFIDNIFQQTGLHNYINFIILGVPKEPEKNSVIKVAKNNPVAEKLGNCPESVVCFLYEEAFDRLDEDTKKLLVEDAVATLSYDTEKDKIIVGCDMISVTLGGLHRHGDMLLKAKETGILSCKQIEDERKERVEQIKAERAAKKAAVKNKR